MNLARIFWINLTCVWGFTYLADGYMVPMAADVELLFQDQCKNFTDGTPQYLHTPGYPDDYLYNLDCRKVLEAGPQFVINLKFNIFKLEASESCRYDYLEIRDGRFGFSPLLFKGCGDMLRNGKIITSSGQYMWIRFVSDGQISRQGFHARISATPQPDPSYTFGDYDCYEKVEDVFKFKISQENLPNKMLSTYQQHPERSIHCVWDIRMPQDSKVLVRLTNFSITHLTSECTANYLAYYDPSTAAQDLRQKHCRPPLSPWISGSSRVLLHLYAHSINTLPDFNVIGNIYVVASTGNCSHKSMFDCYDGHCIPDSLRCDSDENCGEGYDEDCAIEQVRSKFRSKYIILFVVVIVGSILLTTLMTIAEVVHKHNAARKAQESKKNTPSSSVTSKTTSRNSLDPSRQRSLSSKFKDGASSAAAVESANGTFTSSRLNENVSFRKPPTPVSIHLPRTFDARERTFDARDRIYALPNISAANNNSLSRLPPAPPTPPPPPMIPDEGKGFRLIYDMTNLGKTGTFEYPPPPSFIENGRSTDYSSTSSSSFNSLPREHTYDVACIDRRNGKPSIDYRENSESTPLAGPSSPPLHGQRSVNKLYTPVTAKRSWTFDDDTDDGAMELTTYISTC